MSADRPGRSRPRATIRQRTSPAMLPAWQPVAGGCLAGRRDARGFQQRLAVRRMAVPGRLRRWFDDGVDQAVVLRHLRGHEEVALDVTLDLLRRPARVLGVDADDDLPQPQNLARMDLDVRGLRRPHAATGLVQDDLAMRQRKSLAL